MQWEAGTDSPCWCIQWVLRTSLKLRFVKRTSECSFWMNENVMLHQILLCYPTLAWFCSQSCRHKVSMSCTSLLLPLPLWFPALLHFRNTILAGPACSVPVGCSTAVALSVLVQWKHAWFKYLTPDPPQRLPAERSRVRGDGTHAVIMFWVLS